MQHEPLPEVQAFFENENQWTATCPYCNIDLDMSGLFDEDEVVECPVCKGKFLMYDNF